MKEGTITNMYKTSPQEIQQMWDNYFPDITLTQTEWFKKYLPGQLMDGLRIALDKRKSGGFEREDEHNIGKYVIGVIKKICKGELTTQCGTGYCVRAELLVPAQYEITEADRARFKAKLQSSGDHHLFNAAKRKSGYGRFWVNGDTIGAHVFAFFLPTGRLPDAKALGGVNGLQVAHTCGRRACCNADHLRLTTKLVNLQERAYSKKSGYKPNARSEASEEHYGSTDGIGCNSNTVTTGDDLKDIFSMPPPLSDITL
jgi:hypothetical protein